MRSIRAIRSAALDFSTTAAWPRSSISCGRGLHARDDQRRDLEQFVLAFDTTFAPIVGQQITLTSDNAAVAGPRIDLMIARAETDFALVGQPGAKECDLVAKGSRRRRGARLPARRRERRLSERSRRGAGADRRAAARPGRRRRPAGDLHLRATGRGRAARARSRRRRHLRPRRNRRRDGSRRSQDPFQLTPTPSSTRTATPTPSRTSICDGDADAAARPPHSNRNTPAEHHSDRDGDADTARDTTPTQHVMVRGDADCNAVLDAADITATSTAMFDPDRASEVQRGL